MATKYSLETLNSSSKSDEDTLEWNDLYPDIEIIEQFGYAVVDFSSQYGSETSISYTTCNLAGAISIYPNYGDYTQACVFRKYGPWWNMAPSSTKRFRRTPNDYYSQDFIEITFKTKVYPLKIDLYETYNPGAVVKILACDTEAGTDVDTGKVMWKTLWSHAPVKTELEARIFSPPLTPVDFPTDLIRLELCHDLLGYYTELDAIVIHGCEVPPPSPKHSADDLEDTVRNLEQVHITCVDESDTQTSPDGQFDNLPDEVIQIILSYLDTPSLGNAARTCKLFHKHCYDSLLFTELNLQPHWTQISDHVLYSLHTRCQMVQRLNLAWAGKNGPLSRSALENFFKACGSCLSCLGLSCCQFVTEETMEILYKHCPVLTDIDLSSCRNVETSGLMYLSKMKRLRKVNLYRTQADIPSVLGLIYTCPDLEHLNLGACSRISSFNDVALALASNCKKLKSLDLWRARTFSDIGLTAIANNCPHLEEIDVGWCSALQSGSGCFVLLAEKCCKLKKLYLTANRTVCDTDLLSIANHCQLLEQLDILGTREVSVIGALRVLEMCKHLKMFDISFCADIDSSTVENWHNLFPRVDLKKSFQS